jgi:hypothetical protein
VLSAAALGLLPLVQPAPAGADTPPTPLGVVSQTDPGDAEFAVMGAGGVRAYRWLISWPALQPRAGVEPDWTETDRIVASLAEHRITALPFVSGSPCFAVDCAREPPSRVHRQPPVGSARGKLEWARFLSQLVDRYGSDGSFWSANPSLPRTPITAWQIWNEQNALRNFAPLPSVTRYAELLAIAAQTIRSRDPKASIVLGGMFGDPRGRGAIDASRFLSRLYAVPGAERSFDVVAVHPYAPTAAEVRRLVEGVRRVMDTHGDSRTALWVTELGWGASASDEGRLVKTVHGQARMLRGAFRLLLAERVELRLAGLLWFAWRDTPPGESVCGWCGTAGLFDAAGTARPAWRAFTKLSGGTSSPLTSGDDQGAAGSVPWLLLAIPVALALTGLWMLYRRRR